MGALFLDGCKMELNYPNNLYQLYPPAYPTIVPHPVLVGALVKSEDAESSSLITEESGCLGKSKPLLSIHTKS